MTRFIKVVAFSALVALVGAACGETERPEPAERVQRGGTFRGALVGDVSAAFDPQKEYYSVTFGLYKCCLLRTLLSYPSKAGTAGAELVPDLAADLPEVSEDELTYTFGIKEGINYAPPYEDTEVVAQDFIRALERTADKEAATGGYPFYYEGIEGFSEFSEGKADSISGLEAPDEHTLVATLSKPQGDFPNRMAMPTTAPIPEGASDGHQKDYGRFLVASGPYMFEGSEELDFTTPPKQQKPVAGYEPGRSIVLVRNPSWEKDTDDIRAANVNRIEIEIGGTEEDISNKVDAGDVDLMIDGVPPAQQIRSYRGDPERRDQVFSHISDAVRYISINMAEPPFDDVAVRKATNWVIDKNGLRRIRGGPLFGDIAGHALIPSILGGELEDYDPYATPDSRGDVERAKEEMRQSQYDTDGDGVCDAPVCKKILLMTDEADPYPDQTALIADNLQQIGITLETRQFERTTMYDKCNDPAAHAALCSAVGWQKDYADAATFGEPLFGDTAIGPDACCNYSLLGAPTDLLERFDYEVTQVPSVDDKITECEETPAGQERFACWAELDQTIMEEVVPWIPWLFDKDVDVVSDRLVNYVWDQSQGNMALDQIGLRGSGE